MVEADHGSDVAQTVARWMVMFLHRPGGQTQFAAPVWVPRATRAACARSAGLHRHSSCRRSPPRPACQTCGDEQQTLQSGVHRAGRRDPGALRRASSSRGRTRRVGIDHRRHSTSSPATAVSVPPSPCAAPSNAASASLPTRTGADSIRNPVRTCATSAPFPRKATPCKSPYPCSRSSPHSTPSAPTRCCSASHRSTSRSSVTNAARFAARTACSASPSMRRSRRCHTPTSSCSPAESARGRWSNDERVKEWVRSAHESTHVHDLGVHRVARARRGRTVERPDGHDALGVLSRARGDWRDRDGSAGRRASRPTDHHRGRRVERDRHGVATGRAAGRPHRVRRLRN